MSDREKVLFKKYVSKSVHYAEFGSGGSTLYVDKQPNILSCISVESDPAFADKIRSECKKSSVCHADIGAVSGWGYPADTTPSDKWLNYSKYDVGTPDTILIDGRFRVACILQSCLTHPNAVLMIHDFTNRPEYHCVLPYLNIIEVADTLVVATIQLNDSIHELYERYKFITD